MGKRVQFVLKLFSYDSELLAAAAEKVIAAGLTELSVESVINGPITLPNIIRRWCLLKSPHVYKDSREHFEIRRYKIIVDISTQVENPLVNLLIPAGVTATIRE